MFKQEGSYTVRIDMVRVVKGRFQKDPNRMDVEIHGVTETENGSWYGSLSGDYIKQGHHTGKREAARTLEILNEIAPIGSDLSRLGELVGKEIEFVVKQNDKGYMNVAWINTRAANVVDPAEAQRELAALFGQPQQPQGGFIPPAQPQYQQHSPLPAMSFPAQTQQPNTGFMQQPPQPQQGGFMPNPNQQQANPWAAR
jgi:hypothetical protein